MFNQDKVLLASFFTSIIMFLYFGALAAELFNLWLLIPCALCAGYVFMFIKINQDKLEKM